MNQELKKACDWFKINKLCLNVSKTNFMVFCAKNKQYDKNNLNIIIDNKPIIQVEKTKFLGVIVDSKLNWNLHIDYIAGKIAKNIGVITRARKVLGSKSLTGLYYTFIYPYLNYCCSVWGNASTNVISKLHLLQKRIVRIISGRPRLSHTHDLFINLKILPIQLLNKFKLSMFCFKHRNGLLPELFNEFLLEIEKIHKHNTRLVGHYYITTPRTTYALNSLHYQAPYTWNNLDKSLHNINCLTTFKRELISHLLSLPH